MDRLKLLAILKKVAPALGAEKSLLPILSHFAFDGKTVTAYNDVVALQTPCDVGFVGCVDGPRLLALLSSSRSKTAEFTESGSDVVLKLGRTKATFTRHNLKDFPFSAPRHRRTSDVELGEDFLRLLKTASLSASQDIATRTRYGITCSFLGEKGYRIYSTDGRTIVAASCSDNLDLSGTVIFVPGFYSLLLGMKSPTLQIPSVGQQPITRDKQNNVTLYGRVLREVNTKQFISIFKNVDAASIPTVPVPKALGRCLERASVVADDTRFKYAEGKLRLSTASSLCDVKDVLPADFGDSPFDIVSSSSCIRRFIEIAEEIGFSENCVLLRGKSFRVLVGTKGS